MEIKASRRVPERTQRPVYDKVRGGTVNNVCAYWLVGRCTRNPCRFWHAESLPSKPPKQSLNFHSKTWRRSPEDGVKCSSISPSGVASKKMSSISASGAAAKNMSISTSECGHETTTKTPDVGVKSQSVSPSGAADKKISVSTSGCEYETTPKIPEKVCQYWLSGICVQGEKCKNLHSWFSGNGFSILAKIDGHNMAVIGIALPCDSTKLYSGGKDNTIRVWDCNTGQCVDVVNLSGEVGSLISEGPWVFVGLPNSIKAWNTQTQTELTFNGPVGQVYAMVVDNDVLYAGTQDGTILAWKPSSQTYGLELAASLKGHSSGVISLCIGTSNKLYSGSMDNTIRVWDCNTLECIQTLHGHTEPVMSVLCWSKYLLSCSLDGTMRAWGTAEGGSVIEEIDKHTEEHGFLKLCGCLDAENKPILLCSCNDNTVRLHDLPSFTERGRLFAKKEVQSIQIGPGGLFFTGDATGQLTVWKLAGEPSAVAS